ncbi:hypothetical protein A1O1_04602 [Capronia coronata CBS 617.96]|uniref:Uncharacterized protein n=1 Tax=Capronia coronata CBS 617.96 TaxID=1182541 RepID=W9Y573_9EURO|nr:uncharacterized protein A1O1_04602 [Capronia coronata CBS 617.96]EXJ87678.1 hypothetical protein A1O1_04602 [Capronia coronata CBS 617.96]
MASTPPAQITSTPETPHTPLHGAVYDRVNNRSLRRTTRSSTKIASKETGSTPASQRRSSQLEFPVTTPRSSQPSTDAASGLYSPQSTPKNKSPCRVQVLSPSSPDLHTSKSKQHNLSSTTLHPAPSSSTTVPERMLPTPAKTPQKKMAPKVGGAARALFQDTTRQIADSASFEPSPRRSRRTKRYNGFSLESFCAEDDSSRAQIQIFTDSRDTVPQVDESTSNPFLAHNLNAETSSARKVAGTVKRRKVSGQKKIDPQVEEAISKDEGMVYVFRGKKVFRRFDDAGDEEEEIDPDELGLLSHTPARSTAKPMKTLTRRSIKPTCLFQTEEQRRARELEKEEEALTDIEGIEGSDGDIAGDSTHDNHSAQKTSRSLRSSSKKVGADALDGTHLREAVVRRTNKPKQASPFDSWPRVKHGLRTEAASLKSRKRPANGPVEDETDRGSTESKKMRT